MDHAVHPLILLSFQMSLLFLNQRFSVNGLREISVCRSYESPTKAAKGTYQNPSVRIHRRKGGGGEQRWEELSSDKVLCGFRIGDSRERRPVDLTFSSRRRQRFRRVVDQYYFAKKLARNRGGTRSRLRAGLRL